MPDYTNYTEELDNNTPKNKIKRIKLSFAAIFLLMTMAIQTLSLMITSLLSRQLMKSTTL